MVPPQFTERLLRVPDIAKQLRKPVSEVWNVISSRHIEVVKDGEDWLVRETDLEALNEALLTPAANKNGRVNLIGLDEKLNRTGA